MPEQLLAFKNSFVEQLVQTVDSVLCEGESIPLENDYNAILLELTADEWTKLFSCILTGGDLVYPDESHQILWSFLKGVECAMTFCQHMVLCFQNDEDVREAMILAFIAELLADPVLAEAFASAMGQIGVGNPSAPNSTGAPNGELAGKIFGDCTEIDVLYGKAYAWVGALNDIAEDVLQWVELYTNDEELAANLADNIPAIGAIPASILETALWLQETVAETYLSAWDTTRQEYWACLIFCEVFNGDCELTPEIVHQVYASQLLVFSPPNFSDDLSTWLAWFVDLLTLDDNEIIGAMHLFIMTVLERTGAIFGSTWRTIQIATQTAQAITPDCDDCETWCVEVFLADDSFSVFLDHNLSPVDRGMNYVAGMGYEGAYWSGFTNEYNQINALINIGAGSANLRHIEIEFNVTAGENTANANNQLGIEDASGVTTGDINHGSYTGGFLAWDGNTTITPTNRPYLQLSIASSDTGVIDPDGVGLWYRLKMWGNGANPFAGYSC